jgi:hypothetical protein
MNEIEIYIESASVEEVIEWLIEYFFVDSKKEIDHGLFKLNCKYQEKHFTVTVNLGVEEKYTSVWLRQPTKIWSSTIDCAAEASRFLSKPVLCEPEKNNEVPSLFLRIFQGREELINIENT